MAQTLFTQAQVSVPLGTTVQEFTVPNVAFATLQVNFNIALADLQDASKSFIYELWILDALGGNELSLYMGFSWTGGHLSKLGTWLSPVASITLPPLLNKPVRIKRIVSTTGKIIAGSILMGFTITAQ